MKAVVFTGHPTWKDGLNPTTRGLWEKYLNAIPELDSYKIYNYYGLTPPEMDRLIGDAEVLVGWFIGPTIDRDFFTRHSNLRYISTLSMGYEPFDEALMAEKGVTLACTPYGANTIAQYTMAMLLNICHNIPFNAELIRGLDWEGGEWKQIEERTSTQIELLDKTMGIIGIGNVGRWVGRLARAFGMKVLGYSRSIKTGPEYDGIEQVSSLDELLSRSDVISMNCSANPSSIGMINRETISKMKDGVIFLNTAQGALVVEDDLADALDAGKIYAAGLDATSIDRQHRHIRLMDCKNAYVTAHIAWAPMDARLRDIRVAAENLASWFKGGRDGVIFPKD